MTELNTADEPLSLTLLDNADVTPLLSPVSVAGLKLRNRLVMAPMTRGFSPDGMPGDDVAAYYARRASSLGLLITEGTYIDASAGSSDRVPRFFGARSLAGWQRVAAAVHAAGGAIFPQLWHLGAQRRPGSPPFPDAPVISPSGLNPAGIAVAEPASVAALEDVTGRVRPRRRRGADGRVRRHRVRPHRRRPRCAGRPRVGGQARRRPPVGNPPYDKSADAVLH